MKIRLPSFRFNIDQLIQWLTVGGVFAPIFIFEIPVKLVFEAIFIVFAVLLIYILTKKLPVSVFLLLGLSVLLIYSITIEKIIGYPIGKTIQQVIMLSFFFILYYIIFGYLKGRYKELFDKYLKLAYVIAILAILQELIYLGIGINIFQMFTYDRDMSSGGTLLRVNVFSGEPSNLATALTPAFVYYLLNIKEYLKKVIVFGLAIFFTISSTTFVIAFLAILYKAIFKSGIKVRAITISCAVLFIMAGSLTLTESEDSQMVADVAMRIEDTMEGLSDLDPAVIEMLNLSSYATVMNIYIAMNAPSRFFGTGIGTHPISYEYIYQSNHPNYGLNMNDAYSGFTRIFSELGIIGILFLFWFIIRNFRHRNYINTAILFFIFSFMLRGGHYTLSGTVFFFFMYYYSPRIDNSSKELPNKLK